MSHRPAIRGVPCAVRRFVKEGMVNGDAPRALPERWVRGLACQTHRVSGESFEDIEQRAAGVGANPVVVKVYVAKLPALGQPRRDLNGHRVADVAIHELEGADVGLGQEAQKFCEASGTKPFAVAEVQQSEVFEHILVAYLAKRVYPFHCQKIRRQVERFDRPQNPGSRFRILVQITEFIV